MPDSPLRLQAAPHYRPPALDDLDSQLHVVDGGRTQLLSAYWDTADLRLARWGASMVQSADHGWAVWQPRVGGGHAPEPTVIAGGEQAPPEGALDLVRAYVRNATLAPVARVRRVRRTHALCDADEQERLRVLSDEVSVLDGRRVAVRYRQIVLEAGPDVDIALVHAVLTRLRAAGAGGPDTANEHARILGPAAAQAAEIETPELGPGSTLEEAVRGMIGSSVIRLLRHDAGVRAGEDPEAVHQARVATRRLRSDLDTFHEVLDPGALRPLRLELKWLGGLLGPVRDTDVLMERLRGRIEDLKGPRRGGGALLDLLGDRRDDARRKLLGAMGGARYMRLLDALVGLAQEPVLKVPGDQPAIAVLPGLASAPWRALAKAVEKLPREPADDQLHAVRIAAKRARYAAEAAAPVAGRPAARFAAAVAEVQQVLGDFNDASVAREWLTSVGPRLDPEAAFHAGVLAERERAMGEASVKGWKKAWNAADRGKLRRWLVSA